MEIGNKVTIKDDTGNRTFEIVDKTRDRECNTLYIIADYETGEYLEDTFYPSELHIVEEN